MSCQQCSADYVARAQHQLFAPSVIMMSVVAKMVMIMMVAKMMMMVVVMMMMMTMMTIMIIWHVLSINFLLPGYHDVVDDQDDHDHDDDDY